MYYLRYRCQFTTGIASLLYTLNEHVVKKLMRHEAEPSALSGFKTTSAFNNSGSIRVKTVP